MQSSGAIRSEMWHIAFEIMVFCDESCGSDNKNKRIIVDL